MTQLPLFRQGAYSTASTDRLTKDYQPYEQIYQKYSRLFTEEQAFCLHYDGRPHRGGGIQFCPHAY